MRCQEHPSLPTTSFYFNVVVTQKQELNAAQLGHMAELLLMEGKAHAIKYIQEQLGLCLGDAHKTVTVLEDAILAYAGRKNVSS